jgi:LPXTG-motif cell wall-anchored protein
LNCSSSPHKIFERNTIKKFAAVALGSIALAALALAPATGANALAPVTAVAECQLAGDVTTTVTVAPGQDIAWNVTGCDEAYWDTLTGPTAFHGNTKESITNPYSVTSPAGTFVCDSDQMEFNDGGPKGYAYIDIICGTALPNTGANFGAVAGTSAMLLMLGLTLVLVVRRRRKA